MPWLPEEHMADVHIIRQDHAKAVQEYEATGSFEATEELVRVTARRARAIRMIHAEDGASPKHLSGMFRCSKTVIREALAAEESENS